MAENKEPLIVVSAVNFTEGGPLEVLRQFLAHLAPFSHQGWRVVALVHDSRLISDLDVEVIAIPEAKSSWFRRLYWEWFGFKRLFHDESPDVWISLHDITPWVPAKLQFVYCHNPAPFYRPSLREIWLEPGLLIFSCLYRYIYRLRLDRNRAVIVQQDWMRDRFQRDFGCSQVWVARPVSDGDNLVARVAPVPAITQQRPYRFFFPALSRAFKNHRVLAEACKILAKRAISPFEVILTLDPKESAYTSKLYASYAGISQLQWVGRLDRSQMDQAYASSDTLVFPSKIETWGLPISEAKAAGLSILLADLPYAHETLGNYDRARFFPPNDAVALAELMEGCISGNIRFDAVHHPSPLPPYANNWHELVGMIAREATSMSEADDNAP